MTISTQGRVSEKRHWVRGTSAVGCAIGAPALALFSGAAAWSVVSEAVPNTLHLFGTQLLAAAAWVLWIAFWPLAIRAVAGVQSRTESARGTVWAWTIVAVAVGIGHAFGLAYAMVWTVIPLGSFATWFF